jgi:hypothetical protein
MIKCALYSSLEQMFAPASKYKSAVMFLYLVFGIHCTNAR